MKIINECKKFWNDWGLILSMLFLSIVGALLGYYIPTLIKYR